MSVVTYLLEQLQNIILKFKIQFIVIVGLEGLFIKEEKILNYKAKRVETYFSSPPALPLPRVSKPLSRRYLMRNSFFVGGRAPLKLIQTPELQILALAYMAM